MDTIKIRRKDLLKIRNDLKRSIKNWDPFLNSIEPCLRDEDWQLIHNIEGLLLNSVRKIERLLKLTKGL
jgi:hypothetical protein